MCEECLRSGEHASGCPNAPEPNYDVCPFCGEQLDEDTEVYGDHCEFCQDEWLESKLSMEDIDAYIETHQLDFFDEWLAGLSDSDKKEFLGTAYENYCEETSSSKVVAEKTSFAFADKSSLHEFALSLVEQH